MQLDIENLLQPVFITDTNGIVTRANRTFTAAFHSTGATSTIINQRLADLPGLKQSSRDMLEPTLRRACRGQPTDAFTLSFSSASNGVSAGSSSHGNAFGSSSRERAAQGAGSSPTREWAVQLSPRRDASGACFGIVGVCVDVTKVVQPRDSGKAAAGAPASSASSMSTDELVEAANVAIFCVDPKGLITEWNSKASGITGFVKSDVVGKHLVNDFITEEFRDDMERVIQLALRGQTTDNFAFPLFNKHGERFELLLNTTPYPNHDGSKGHATDGSLAKSAPGVLGIVQVSASA